MTKYKESGKLKKAIGSQKKEKAFFEEGAVIRNDITKAPHVNEWRQMHPEVLKDKCIGCATCAAHCPEATIEMSDAAKPKAKIDLKFCKGCGVCAQVCPTRAIIMKRER